MENNGIENYRKMMQQMEENPSDRAWNRLDDKLQLRSNKKNVIKYKWLTIAASTIAILSFVGIYQHQLHEHNPQIFAYNSDNSDPKPLFIEEIRSNDDTGLYAIERLQNLSIAYEELGM